MGRLWVGLKHSAWGNNFTKELLVWGGARGFICRAASEGHVMKLFRHYLDSCRSRCPRPSTLTCMHSPQIGSTFLLLSNPFGTFIRDNQSKSLSMPKYNNTSTGRIQPEQYSTTTNCQQATATRVVQFLRIRESSWRKLLK